MKNVLPGALVGFIASVLFSIECMASASISSEELAGTWACEAEPMVGRGVRVDVSYETSFAPDGTYASSVASTTRLDDGRAVVVHSSETGSWSLRDDLLKFEVATVHVTSTDSQEYPVAVAQKHSDEQLALRKSSESRLVSLEDGITIRPVDPLYAEADVLTKCLRSESDSSASP